MPIKIMTIIAIILFSVNGCAAQPRESLDSPRMTVVFMNAIGKCLLFDNAIMESGERFGDLKALYTGANNYTGWWITPIKTASDGRQLPEWVEFTWVETDCEREKLFASSKHKERVAVRERVPSSVIAEITASNRNRELSESLKKSLEIGFVWTDRGVKFIWALVIDNRMVQFGGDDIP